jgi:hypothetical protein
MNYLYKFQQLVIIITEKRLDRACWQEFTHSARLPDRYFPAFQGNYGAFGGYMALYSASIKYKFGSNRATTSTNVATNQLKGKSESAVMEFLRQKHKSIKNLEIFIERIDWK